MEPAKTGKAKSKDMVIPNVAAPVRAEHVVRATSKLNRQNSSKVTFFKVKAEAVDKTTIFKAELLQVKTDLVKEEPSTPTKVLGKRKSSVYARGERSAKSKREKETLQDLQAMHALAEDSNCALREAVTNAEKNHQTLQTENVDLRRLLDSLRTENASLRCQLGAAQTEVEESNKRRFAAEAAIQPYRLRHL